MDFEDTPGEDDFSWLLEGDDVQDSTGALSAPSAEDTQLTGTPSEQEDIGVAPAEPSVSSTSDAPAELSFDDEPAEMGIVEADRVTIPAQALPVVEAPPAEAPPAEAPAVDLNKVYGDLSRQQKRTMKQAGFDVDSWYESIFENLGEGGPGRFNEQQKYEYLVARSTALGNPPPDVRVTGMHGDVREHEGLAGTTLIINTLGSENLAQGKTLDELVAGGLTHGYFGPEWTDWYVEAVNKTGMQGWLTTDQEKSLGLLSSGVESKGESGLAGRSNEELLSMGTIDAYGMLGQREVIDLDAMGRAPTTEYWNQTVETRGADAMQPSTWQVLKHARVLEASGKWSEEALGIFKRNQGVTEEEESAFLRLLFQEGKAFRDTAAGSTEALAVGQTEKVLRREKAVAVAKEAFENAPDRERAARREALEQAEVALLAAKGGEVLPGSKGPLVTLFEEPTPTSSTITPPRAQGLPPGASADAAFTLAGDRVHQKTRIAAKEVLDRRARYRQQELLQELNDLDINKKVEGANALLLSLEDLPIDAVLHDIPLKNHRKRINDPDYLVNGTPARELFPYAIEVINDQGEERLNAGLYEVYLPDESDPKYIVRSPAATRYLQQALQEKIKVAQQEGKPAEEIAWLEKVAYRQKSAGAHMFLDEYLSAGQVAERIYVDLDKASRAREEIAKDIVAFEGGLRNMGVPIKSQEAGK